MLSHQTITELLEKSRVEMWDQEKLGYELEVLLTTGGDVLERVGHAHRTVDGRGWQVHGLSSLHMNDQVVYVLRDPEQPIEASGGVFTLLMGNTNERMLRCARALLTAYDGGAVSALDGPMEALRDAVVLAEQGVNGE